MKGVARLQQLAETARLLRRPFEQISDSQLLAVMPPDWQFAKGSGHFETADWQVAKGSGH